MLKRFLKWRRRYFWAQMRATNTLQNAWTYLYAGYYSTASNRDRGFILQDTQDALDILYQKAHDSLEHSLEL